MFVLPVIAWQSHLIKVHPKDLILTDYIFKDLFGLHPGSQILRVETSTYVFGEHTSSHDESVPVLHHPSSLELCDDYIC